MKGLVVERANPSNTIDLFPLMRQAAKEGVYPGPPPTDLHLKQFYFRLLKEILPNPHHYVYLAKRGRGYLGYCHAIFVPGRWNGQIDKVVVDMIFVVEKRRNYGIAKKLLEQLREDAENLGIKKIEFLAKDELLEKWTKKYNAKRLANAMRVEI